MPGIREYIAACEYRRKFLEEQRIWLRDEQQQFEVETGRLRAVELRIREELMGYLFPDVHDEHLAALETRLSYPGLRPIKAKYEAMFLATEERRVEIEAMDEFQHYEYLIDEATKKVAEIQPAYDAMRSKLEPWENSKWFSQLNKRGYFALDYQAGLWHRFWDWRAVSLLMGSLAKHASLKFAEPESLKVHFRQLRSEADDVFAAYEKREAERNRILQIKQEHDELLATPERLLSELHAELGEAAVTHIDACPESMRLELARGDKHLNAFLRKLTGVRKQIQYLRELPITRIAAKIQQVDQELTKTNSKIQKLQLQKRRGKRKRYSSSDLSRMRNVKADKWQRRREKTAKLRGKISSFDKYDRGSISSDYLWWDLMTGGAAADDIFEVREFRSRNPNWNYRDHSDSWLEDDDDPMSLGAASLYDDAADDLQAAMNTSHDEDLFTDPS